MPVRKASFGLSIAALCSTLYLALHYITNSINNAIKEPYMDEKFHVPQAQRYCQGNFTYYDPKLTTPPGLYLLTYLRIWFRDKLLMRRLSLICDTLDLRRTNHLIAIGNFVMIVLIQLATNDRVRSSRKFGLSRLKYTLDQSSTLDLINVTLTSIATLLLPPLFFFNSLYYTDAGSVLYTLLAYFLSIIGWHVLASISGIISVSFRQTNIVWIFYIACLVILRTFREQQVLEHGSASGNARDGRSLRDILTNRALLTKLSLRCAPYALVGLLFVVFVVWNNGIVLGDKEAHQARLHFAQILYFLGFCAIFGATWIFHLRILRRFLYFTIRSPLTAVVVSAFIVYLISFGRYAHPYLLADNRHLTFYIWRRILDRHNSYVPYLLTPIYLLTSFSIWHHLRSKSCKQVMLYIFCTILVTVPNGLLEPRYFIIPYIFLRLNAETNSVTLLFEIVQHVIINVSMHYLFLHKTFRWADSPEVQRIMW